MNTSLVAKSFTAVVVLLVALNGWSVEEKELTPYQCKQNCESTENRNSHNKTCRAAGGPSVSEDKIFECVNGKIGECKGECDAGLISPKEKEANCKEAFTEYKKTNEKIKLQCKRAKQGSTEKCKNTANRCGESLDLGGFENNGEETPEESENILKNIFGIFSDGEDKQSAAADSCAISDDKDQAANTRAINKEISSLRADISTLKEDAAKADDDVAKKKQEVEDDILKLEKEMDKKTTDRKTEAQKETVKMQEAALDAIKRKKAALKAVEERNRTIANLRIQQQEEAIKFTQSNLMKACRDQALELKARLIADATKAAAVSKQSTAVTGNIKKDVETFGKQCIKLAGIERNKAYKATLDKITIENSAIKDLNDSIKLDDQAAANRQKDLEAREKITNEEQTKAEEKKTKELGQLSQKVADIQALVEKKKVTFAEKAKAKEDEINQLILQLNNKSSRFNQISADIDEGSSQASVFVERCCEQKTYKRFCETQLYKDFPEETKAIKKTKPGKKQ